MRSFAFVSCLLAFAAQPAAAVPLAPPASRVQCVVSPGSGSVFDPASCALGEQGSAIAVAGVSVQPVIALSGAVAAPAAPVNIVSAAITASLSYEFQVTGGNPGDVVPVIISVGMDTHGGDGVHSRGSADIHVVNSFGFVTDIAACTAGSGCGGAPSFHGSFSTPMRSGGPVGTVDLTISAFAGSSRLDQAASASLDPYIVVDPAFADAALYTVTVSPGVANVPLPAVPEPASALLLAVGLATLLPRAARRCAGRTSRASR